MNPVLSTFLHSFRLDRTEVRWDDVKKAVNACEKDLPRSLGVTHRLLFTLLRSAWMGDERDHLGFFHDPGDGSAAVYWVGNAGGIGTLKRLDRVDSDEIQAFLSGLLADLEWGPLQFFGCEIINEAPDLLPKAFFTRLLQEAYDRYPDEDFTDAETGDDWSNPADWVEEHYDEYGPA